MVRRRLGDGRLRARTTCRALRRRRSRASGWSRPARTGSIPQGFLDRRRSSAVERAAARTARSSVRPAVDFSHIDVVLVVLDAAGDAPGGDQ